MKNRHLFRPPVDNTEEYRSRLMQHKMDNFKEKKFETTSFGFKQILKNFLNKIK